MTDFPANTLLSRLFRSGKAATIFSDHGQVEAMLQVEAALARVEGEAGVIPVESAIAIASCCASVELDLNAVAEAAAQSGNIAIPLVSSLTKAVAERSPGHEGHVHWGATSQDILDTALVLQLKEFIGILEENLAALGAVLAELTRTHRTSVMAGRTWLQHAVPVTFGLKTAGWLDALLRHQSRVQEMKRRVLVLQFGGAAGTLASLGDRGLELTRALAAELDLEVADIPWHSSRDRVCEVATTLGLLMGTLGKIARDLALMGQTEIGEVAEGKEPGRGGSSTMPHKRNPVGSAAILSSAIRVPNLVATVLSAMVQESERGLGGWHAEWETLPEIATLTLGALQTMRAMLHNLDVYPERMRSNLDVTQGLLLAEAFSMALAQKIGRDKAHSKTQAISRRSAEGDVPLKSLILADAELMQHFTVEDIEQLFRPANYLGSAQQMVDQVLQRYAEERA